MTAWRSTLVKLRDEERRHAVGLSLETGRFLEIVGQALAQGGGVLPPDDIAHAVQAQVAQGMERRRLFDHQAAQMQFFAEYDDIISRSSRS